MARQYGIEPADLKANDHSTGLAKAIVITLACRLTGWSHRAISVYYGEIRGTAVSAARRRLHEGAAEKDLRLTFATLSSHAGTLWILQTGCGLVFSVKTRDF